LIKANQDFTKKCISDKISELVNSLIFLRNLVRGKRLYRLRTERHNL